MFIFFITISFFISFEYNYFTNILSTYFLKILPNVTGFFLRNNWIRDIYSDFFYTWLFFRFIHGFSSICTSRRFNIFLNIIIRNIINIIDIFIIHFLFAFYFFFKKCYYLLLCFI